MTVVYLVAQRFADAVETARCTMARATKSASSYRPKE